MKGFGMRRQRALVFLRHYNDVDHVVPVLYKWLSSRQIETHLVLAGAPEMIEDYRIAFLRRFDHLHLHHVEDFVEPGQDDREASRAFDHQQRLHERRLAAYESFLQGREAREARDLALAALPRLHPARLARKVRRIWREARYGQGAPGLRKPSPPAVPESLREAPNSYARYGDDVVGRIVERCLGETAGGILICDWVTDTMKAYLGFVEKVVRACKARGMVTVSLPHGDEPHACRMIRRDELNYSVVDIYSRGSLFDYVVVPNDLCRVRYAPHLPPDRIKVLGSPRYNDEWIEILTGLLPVFEAPEATGKLKAVLFLRHFLYPLFWDEILRTLDLITQFQDVHLVVKHHTRDFKLKQMLEAYPGLREGERENLQIDYGEIHSGSLVRWADVVLDLGTSAAFEAIKLGKPVLSPEYLHATTTTVAHYMKDSVLLCRDHLYDAIDGLRRNRDHTVCDDATRGRFIRQVIDGPDPAVLDRHASFLSRCLESSRP